MMVALSMHLLKYHDIKSNVDVCEIDKKIQ